MQIQLSVGTSLHTTTLQTSQLLLISELGELTCLQARDDLIYFSDPKC